MEEIKPPTITACLQAVTQTAPVSREEILSERRTREISRARMMVCWVARKATPYSTMRIGAVLSIDHTSVMYAIKRIDELRETVPFIKEASDKALRLALTDPRQLEIAV